MLTPRSVFRRFETDGVPSSGPHDPAKEEIIQLLESIQSTGGQSIVKNTLAQLNATTPPTEGYGGIVLSGAAAGYYSRAGGVWVFGRAFPDTFAKVVLSGSGSSQVGTVKTGVNPATIEVFYAKVTSENEGPLTLSISGEPPRAVINLAGNSLSVGEWTGLVMFYRNDAGEYQLMIDAGAAASAAQSASDADAAKEEARAARDQAINATVFNPVSKRFISAGAGPYDMGVPIGTPNLIDVKLGGVWQDHDTYTVSGTAFTLTTNPGAGLPMEAILRADVRVVNQPADASVVPASLAPSAVSYLDGRYLAGGRQRGSFIPKVEGRTTPGAATYQKAVGVYDFSDGWMNWACEVQWTGHTGTGAMKVSGLPMASAGLNSPVSIAAADITFPGGGDLQGVVAKGTMEILMQARVSGGSTPAVAMGAAGTLRMSGSYPIGNLGHIVFMGDSVTVGVRPGVTEQDTFRFKVQNALGWVFADNKGIGGQNAQEMRARFGADVFTSGANAVCIMSGINDFYDPLPVPQFTTALQEMIAAAIAANIKVTLCSANATPDPVMLAGFDPWLVATRNVAAANPSVVYVPVYEAFIAYLSANGPAAFAALFTDGQHPNPAGHDLITQTILATPGACLPAE